MVDVTRFNEMVWHDDRMLLGDLVFRLHHFRRDDWELGDDCFALIKTKPLMQQYARFFASRADFQVRNLFELGMWDGGSVALWYELLHPEKHVAVDLEQRDDSAYFSRYVETHQLRDRIATFWRTDQADLTRLREIVAGAFNGPLDLVIDDASHMYASSKASLEMLFPLLRQGGLYIIEDWAWDLWPEFHSPDHPWAAREPFSRLAHDLLGVTGSFQRGAIGTMTVYPGFIAIERGWASLPKEGFSLEDYYTPRPEHASSR